MKRGKKGQFYIIAAVIIAVLLAGLATTINYAITSATPTRFFDLSQQYNTESAKVIDYGVYQKYTPEVDINEKLISFTNQFYANAKIKDPNIEIIPVYGNSTEATIFTYTTNETNVAYSGTSKKIGSINKEQMTSLQITSTSSSTLSYPLPYPEKTTVSGTKIGIMPFGETGTQYNIELKQDQQFYFIIMSKKATGEVNVATG